MLEKKSKQGAISIFTFKMVYKVILLAGFAVVCITAFLNYFFIQELSEPRINQVKEIANTTSVIVSELALSSFYDQDPESLTKALKGSMKEAGREDGGFLQISIILFPAGVYYSSTYSDFINKRVGQSLYKKIEANLSTETVVEKLNYEMDNRTIPVLQFLRNISIVQGGEEKVIAVTQILFDYGKIISRTRQTLLTIAGVFLLFIIALAWIMYLPITRVHKKLIEGFRQISKRNFDYTFSTRGHGEIGLLFANFNEMAAHLKAYFKERQKTKIDSVINDLEGTAIHPKESVLRKSKITCLCARIPAIQNKIDEKSVESIAESIHRFISPFDKVVHEFGGQFIKVLGDKVYVLFEGINSVDNAIRTALKINQVWQAENHENKVLNRKKLDFGIGIHCSEGIAGTLSHEGATSTYTIIGKAASIADYLCLCAKSEEILVSSSLMDKTSGSYQHQVIDDLKPEEFSENEQILVITNLQLSDDAVIGGRRSEHAGVQGFWGTGDSAAGPSGNQGAPFMSRDFAKMTGASFDSSIPGMLEETLNISPLDPVASNEKIEKKEDEDPDNKRGNKKQSLWDEFDGGGE